MFQTAAALPRRLALIHRAWRYRLRVERNEVAFLRRHVKAGDIALDIGAHKGGFTYWLNKSVGDTGRVIAFEPLPALAAYLRRLVREQPLKQVTIVEAALSNRAGSRTFFVPTAGHLGMATLRQNRYKHQAIEIQSLTLDQFCREQTVKPIAFIKCDVEGHELEMFQGAEQVLAEDRPILLFECCEQFHPDGGVERVFSFLRRFRYEGCFFLNNRTVPLSHFRPEHQRRHGCFNFGFLPA